MNSIEQKHQNKSPELWFQGRAKQPVHTGGLDEVLQPAGHEVTTKDMQLIAPRTIRDAVNAHDKGVVLVDADVLDVNKPVFQEINRITGKKVTSMGVRGGSTAERLENYREQVGDKVVRNSEISFYNQGIQATIKADQLGMKIDGLTVEDVAEQQKIRNGSNKGIMTEDVIRNEDPTGINGVRLATVDEFFMAKGQLEHETGPLKVFYLKHAEYDGGGGNWKLELTKDGWVIKDGDKVYKCGSESEVKLKLQELSGSFNIQDYVLNPGVNGLRFPGLHVRANGNGPEVYAVINQLLRHEKCEGGIFCYEGEEEERVKDDLKRVFQPVAARVVKQTGVTNLGLDAVVYPFEPEERRKFVNYQKTNNARVGRGGNLAAGEIERNIRSRATLVGANAASYPLFGVPFIELKQPRSMSFIVDEGVPVSDGTKFDDHKRMLVSNGLYFDDDTKKGVYFYGPVTPANTTTMVAIVPNYDEQATRELYDIYDRSKIILKE